MFRPAAIIPQHGIRSSTKLYNVLYVILKPIFPILRRLSPTSVTTTDQLSSAMITVARDGYKKPILEMEDIITF